MPLTFNLKVDKKVLILNINSTSNLRLSSPMPDQLV